MKQPAAKIAVRVSICEFIYFNYRCLLFFFAMHHFSFSAYSLSIYEYYSIFHGETAYLHVS